MVRGEGGVATERAGGIDGSRGRPALAVAVVEGHGHGARRERLRRPMRSDLTEPARGRLMSPIFSETVTIQSLTRLTSAAPSYDVSGTRYCSMTRTASSPVMATTRAGHVGVPSM